MPAVSHRGPSRRRTISEINMVPFIDVMLVLLIIFMVTAPLITTGVVDLPSVGKSRQRPDHVIELVVGADEKLRVRVDGKDSGKDGDPLALRNVAAKVAEMQGGDANTPVVISADRNVKYDAVVKVMDTLQKSGVQRVGLSVKGTGG
jgi:biopolymer transport protein TolR